ncbi:MAG: hypothetical protein ABIO39_10050 [Caulobacteraceae bacterium]
MKTTLATAVALMLAASTVQAQPAAGDSHSIKLSNGEKQAITSVYASEPGRKDWGDDLLGKQVGAPGKTVTLKIKGAACVYDLQMLMNDGSMVVKAGVDVCAQPDYRFSKQSAAAPPAAGGG